MIQGHIHFIAATSHKSVIDFTLTAIPKDFSQLLPGPLLFSINDSDPGNEMQNMLIMSSLEDGFGKLKNWQT